MSFQDSFTKNWFAVFYICLKIVSTPDYELAQAKKGLIENFEIFAWNISVFKYCIKLFLFCPYTLENKCNSIFSEMPEPHVGHSQVWRHILRHLLALRQKSHKPPPTFRLGQLLYIRHFSNEIEANIWPLNSREIPDFNFLTPYILTSLKSYFVPDFWYLLHRFIIKHKMHIVYSTNVIAANPCRNGNGTLWL